MPRALFVHRGNHWHQALSQDSQFILDFSRKDLMIGSIEQVEFEQALVRK